MEFKKQHIERENEDTDDRKLSEKNGINQDIGRYVENIAKREGYVSYQIVQKLIPTANANFTADLFLVDIKGKTKNGASETNLFIKKILSSERCKLFNINELYELELFAYKSLYKVFTDIQNDANVPSEMRFKMAKCYEESDTETIILENAMKKGFETFHKLDVLSLKHAELAVIELAKFHALALAIKHNMPNYFKEHIKKLKFPEVPDDLTETTFKITLDAFDKDPCLEKLRAFLDITKLRFIQLMSDNVSPGCCLCHGDYRLSNILAKMMDGQVVEILPVDYQLMYYGNPLQDFLGLLFLNTDQEFRRNHLNDLKNLYFDTLKQFLRYLKLDVKDVYPRIIFEKDFKERLDYGLVLCLMVLPFLFTADDEAVDMGADEFKLNNVNTKFNDRIRGIVHDFIDWGYL